MKKPPLILLHGALGAGEQFDPWLSHLMPHFEIFTPDFEGHGTLAPGDKEYSILHFANQLEGFIRRGKLEGASVFGYSMGGYVALYSAIKSPGLIGKIFTFATKFEWNPETSAKEAKMLSPEKMKEKIPVFVNALRVRHGDQWNLVVDKTAAMMIELGNNPLIDEQAFLSIQIPVKLGIGGLDNRVSLQETESASKKILNGELFVMKDTEHPLEKIDAEKISVEIINYFDRNRIQKS